ncbi:hypothetical protein B0H12DRAFT_1235392 [Mycena haematopus]|nr:hypothetical protein B0H12DRAFT_1235392 [Mycena haematopus]
MSSALAPTFGIWLVAQFFQAILYGMGLLQVYLYFFWYPEDSWGTKGTVLLITVLETVQTGTYFSATYTLLIDDFGDFQRLALFPWQALAQLLAVYTSTFVAQAYFARCIYLLHKKKVLLPLVIVILSLVGLGGGVAQIILAVRIQRFDELPTTSAASNTQAALALACDILITDWDSIVSSQPVTFDSSPFSASSPYSTNKLLNFLIMTAINRGVLTMVTALLNMVLFLSQPGTFYFMLMILISGKFYMNSMLAMLNTRQHAHSVGQFGAVIDHISMPSLRNGNSRNAQILAVDVTVSCETSHDRDKAGF